MKSETIGAAMFIVGFLVVLGGVGTTDVDLTASLLNQTFVSLGGLFLMILGVVNMQRT